MKPFCQGDPGSMNAVSTPAVSHQPISAPAALNDRRGMMPSAMRGYASMTIRM